MWVWVWVGRGAWGVGVDVGVGVGVGVSDGYNGVERWEEEGACARGGRVGFLIREGAAQAPVPSGSGAEGPRELRGARAHPVAVVTLQSR